MSTLNIPDIDINSEKSLNLLILAVALEELGLANIIQAEAEKIQFVLGALEKEYKKEPPTIDDLLKINKSAGQMIKRVIEKEMLIDFILEDAIDLTQSLTEESEDKKDEDKDEDKNKDKDKDKGKSEDKQ